MRRSERSGLLLQDGAEVESAGRRFVIVQLLGFDFVVARDVETLELRRLAVVDLNPLRHRGRLLRSSQTSPSSTIMIGPKHAGDWSSSGHYSMAPAVLVRSLSNERGAPDSTLQRCIAGRGPIARRVCSHRCFHINLVAAAAGAASDRRSSRS